MLNLSYNCLSLYNHKYISCEFKVVYEKELQISY